MRIWKSVAVISLGMCFASVSALEAAAQSRGGGGGGGGGGGRSSGGGGGGGQNLSAARSTAPSSAFRSSNAGSSRSLQSSNSGRSNASQQLQRSSQQSSRSSQQGQVNNRGQQQQQGQVNNRGQQQQGQANNRGQQQQQGQNSAGRNLAQGAATSGVLQGRSSLGAGNLRQTSGPASGLRSGNLIRNAVAGHGQRLGRVGVPGNISPRISLLKAPSSHFHTRLTPFVQRHWRGAFFWTFVTGIGYLTVPELLHDKFYALTSGPEPDYEACVVLLSEYAVQEEAGQHVRVSAPATVNYRFVAPAAPAKAELEVCKFDPFVERKWNTAFVWVQVPEVGNVTVPEDHYERFFQYAGNTPPDFPAACRVLVDAAAADTVVSDAEAQ